MFDFIDQNGLYSKQGQERFDQDIVFPLGSNPVTNNADPSKNVPGKMGGLLRRACRVLYGTVQTRNQYAWVMN